MIGGEHFTFLDGLQLLFIAFKLVGIITWNWWVVLTPIWFVLVLYCIEGIFQCIKEEYYGGDIDD